MKEVFLSGPIRGIPRDQSLGWRATATKLLESDFIVSHALRGREEKETLPDPRLAIIRDKTDIFRSEILLVNDTFANASMIGTAMEVMYAFDKGKVIIVFGEAHSGDYWLDFHVHARCKTLEDACALLKSFFK